jgi:glycosyltransferase involved in cell wall biosynthesis
MAMEKPVIATSIGVSGLRVRPEVEFLLANEPQAFADAVVRVLRNPQLAWQLGQQAAATVRANCGWERVAAEFAEHCADVLHSPSREILVAGARSTAAD